MAFTATQHEQIYTFLGYDCEDTDADLEERIAAVEARGATVEATVTDLLAKLVTVEAAFAASGSSSSSTGALKKADDIEWFDTKETVTVAVITPADYGQLLVSRLAKRFDLDPDALPFYYFGEPASIGAGVASREAVSW